MRVLTIGFLAVAIGCAATDSARVASAGAAATLPSELDRVLRDYERAWRAKDAAALASLFAEDGYVLSNTRLPVRGRDAIRVAYTAAGGPLWLRSLSHATDGSVGYIIGVYGHEPNAPESGKFVLALRRVNAGPWLIAADIDNSIDRQR